MNHTTNYQLTQWEADDRIRMEDFNDNNAKLDTAIRANADAITALGTSKANAASLGAETQARENADSALGGRIDSEAAARASAVSALGGRIDAEESARAAAVAAVQSVVTGDGGKLGRVAYGSYVGTGTYGSSNPVTLSCSFRPLAVLMRNVARSIFSGSAFTVYLRGVEESSSIGTSGKMQLTWGSSSVSWYNDEAADQQNNTSGTTYYYVILGDDE